MGNTDITILMATLNGAAYLAEQLESIAGQTHRPTGLVISDDGSSDATRDIIAGFTATAPFPVFLIDGPQKGLAQNMLSMLQHGGTGNVAFADQDDVWLPDKLGRAQEALLQQPANLPALYTARRIITDASLKPAGLSARLCRKPSFANALVQNIAPSNTIVLNAAAVTLAQSAAPEAMKDVPPFHDWWLYQLISGVGGSVIFDPAPALYYRQHGTNYLGAGYGVLGRTSRIRAVFDGSFGGWIRAQARALEHSAHRLDPDAQACLKQVLIALQSPRPPLRRLGLFRQSQTEQMLLQTASYLGRL